MTSSSRRFRVLAVPALLALLMSAALDLGTPAMASTSATSGWTQLGTTNYPPAPSPRFGAAMAYGPGVEPLVLFGGEAALQAVGDTWTWNGTTWTQRHPVSSPPAQYGASMAYDYASHQLIFFGASATGGDAGDTWTWDGTTWTQLQPADSPPVRLDASMAFDPRSGRLLLFGGMHNGSSAPFSPGTELGDTWAWTGTDWTKLSTMASPSPRWGAAAAYDPATDNNIVLFGGANGSGERLSDTWSWTGADWTQLHPASVPDSRHGATMTYDENTNRLVLFGGNGYYSDLHATWTWDGSNWTLIDLNPLPPARRYASMAYDFATGQLILFGGGTTTGSLNDTWVYGDPMARQHITFTSSPPDNAAVGGVYTVTALGGGSNTPVVFSSDPSSTSGACTVSDGGAVAFTGAGTCVIDADQAGNAAYYAAYQVRQTIIVGNSTTADTTAPILQGTPADIVTEATTASGSTVGYTAPTAVDDVDGTDPAACLPASGAMFPLGATTVICTTSDQAGNRATSTFTVTVQDTTAPTLHLPAYLTVPAAGTATQVSWTASATDAVDGTDPVVCTPPSGTTFAAGSTTVSCHATDAAGNTSTGSFPVRVLYQWDGFLQPINDTAHQTSTAVSVFKAGSTVPVKFQLKPVDGTTVQAATLPVFLTPERGSATSATVDEGAYSDPGTLGSNFTYDAVGQQYQYNWKTSKDMTGYWWRIAVLLPDGTRQYVTIGLR